MKSCITTEKGRVGFHSEAKNISVDWGTFSKADLVYSTWSYCPFVFHLLFWNQQALINKRNRWKNLRWLRLYLWFCERWARYLIQGRSCKQSWKSEFRFWQGACIFLSFPTLKLALAFIQHSIQCVVQCWCLLPWKVNQSVFDAVRSCVEVHSAAGWFTFDTFSVKCNGRM